MMETDYNYRYHKLKCKTCGRKILVECVIGGADHTLAVLASCAECLKSGVDEKFAEKRPGAAKDIMAWVNEEW